jgi:hypothetical protein
VVETVQYDYPSENLQFSDTTRSRHQTLPLDTYPPVVFLDSRVSWGIVISGESLGSGRGVRGTKTESSDDMFTDRDRSSSFEVRPIPVFRSHFFFANFHPLQLFMFCDLLVRQSCL